MSLVPSDFVINFDNNNKKGAFIYTISHPDDVYRPFFFLRDTNVFGILDDSDMYPTPFLKKNIKLKNHSLCKNGSFYEPIKTFYHCIGYVTIPKFNSCRRMQQ
jgi:hypothetical protein